MLRTLGVITALAFLFVATSRADYPIGYDPAYVRAVTETRHDSGELPRVPRAPLTAITEDNRDLIWKNDVPGGELLMAVFTDYPQYDRNYSATPAYRPELWATVAPELHEFLLDHEVSGAEAALRTRQLLGMPAGHRGDRVVEMWVAPDSLFRPALDPSITTSTTPLDVPADTSQYTKNYENYWVSTFAEWRELQSDTYQGAVPYPWTDRGYTYDWGSGDPDDIVGLSEFIVKAHSEESNVVNPASVYAVVSIGSYPYYDHQGSFWVTGDCDTIWAGTRYTPAGDSIVIESGATVWGGVTVSSAGYRLENSGIITGPGRNLDNTYRSDAVEFELGGTLINLGTIEGAEVGVAAASLSTAEVDIRNSGLISAAISAIRTASGDDRLVNRGQIAGDVELAAGDDEVIMEGGSLFGDLDGGAGEDSVEFDAGSGSFAAFGDILNFESLEVANGSALLNGRVQGSVSVMAEAVLGGEPTIEGNLDTWGTVAPGNSIGVVSVDGDYRQHVGSTLEIEFTKPMESVVAADRLLVAGDAEFEDLSTIRVVYLSGGEAVVRPGDTFVILDADGTISDGGLDVVTDSAFVSFAASMPWYNGAAWHPGSVLQLTVDRTASFESVAEGSRQIPLAEALDADLDTAIGEFASLANDLLFMDAEEFNDAASRLSPAPYHAANAAALRTTQHFGETLADYLRTRRTGGLGGGWVQPEIVEDLPLENAPQPDEESTLPDATDDEAVVRQQGPECGRYAFVRTFGLFHGERNGEERVGFQAGSPGLLVGVDRQLSDSLLAGLQLGYADTDLRYLDGRGGGDLDVFRLGPYLSYFNPTGYVDFSATWGHHHQDLSRRIELDEAFAARGESSGDDVALYLGGGRHLQLGWELITPTIALQYVSLGQDPFVETGAAGANLLVTDNNLHSLRTTLGMRLTRSFCLGPVRVVREFSGGWAHESLADDGVSARFATGETVFTTERAGLARDSAYYGTARAAVPNGTTAIFVRYQGELARSGQFDAVDLGLTVDF